MDIRDFLCRAFSRLGITKNHWPIFLLEYGNMQLFQLKVGYKFDLDKAETMPEKIQWYKTRFKMPDQVRYVDKYLFKDMIKEKLGGQIIQFPCMEHGPR